MWGRLPACGGLSGRRSAAALEAGPPRCINYWLGQDDNMQFPAILNLPRAVPMLPERPPQANIPQTSAEREGMRVNVQRYVAANRDRLVPPLVLDELRTLTGDLIARSGADPKYRDYAGVLLNNEIWREQLATVPFERRLL